MKYVIFIEDRSDGYEGYCPQIYYVEYSGTAEELTDLLIKSAQEAKAIRAWGTFKIGSLELDISDFLLWDDSDIILPEVKTLEEWWESHKYIL